MQLKEWYIDLNGKSEGPYSVLDLRLNPFITPETLVWKEGFVKWVPMGSVPELKAVFKDPEEPRKITPNSDKKVPQVQDELVMDMSKEPPDFLWLLIVALILVYFLIQLYWV
jgi:hypothetical protein